MASISSMNTIAGAAFRACSNRSRTMAAPTPARRSLGQEGLAGAGRSDEKNTLGDARAKPGELLRGLEELDNLLKFRDRLVGAAHIRERHPDLLGSHPSGLAAADSEHTPDTAPRGPAHSAIDEVPHDTDEDEGEKVKK